jgi:predicted GNAT family N-acyltransferase
MAVRESVFVHEQSVPLDNELDADDARSYHWIAYASVARRGSGDAVTAGSAGSAGSPEGRRESDSSTAIKVPVGTLRLIPPTDPLQAHDSAQTAPHLSVFKHEPYILLGRLAVTPDYRRMGLGRLLVNAALDWARKNGHAAFTPSNLSPAELEGRKLRFGPEEESGWKGLVVVHSQTGVPEKAWARMGFARDDGMGEWVEEGIEHVGMWKRIDALPPTASALGRGRAGSVG